jgi:hypothetical protein
LCRASFIILYNDQQMRNYVTNYHAPPLSVTSVNFDVEVFWHQPGVSVVVTEFCLLCLYYFNTRTLHIYYLYNEPTDALLISIFC